jgi:hypothetical protein
VTPVRSVQRVELEDEAARAFAFAAPEMETRDIEILKASWIEG